jgi:hypothetical protein
MQNMQLQDNQPQSFAASYLRALSASSASFSFNTPSNVETSRQHSQQLCNGPPCNSTSSMHHHHSQLLLSRQSSFHSTQQQLAPAAFSGFGSPTSAAGCSFSSSSSSSLSRCGSGAYVSPFAGSLSSILTSNRDQSKVSRTTVCLVYLPHMLSYVVLQLSQCNAIAGDARMCAAGTAVSQQLMLNST